MPFSFWSNHTLTVNNLLLDFTGTQLWTGAFFSYSFVTVPCRKTMVLQMVCPNLASYHVVSMSCQVLSFHFLILASGYVHADFRYDVF